MARRRKDETEGAKPPDDEKKPRRRRKPRDGDKKEPARLGNPDADPVRIHREYVERRMGGGAEATTEAYARALKQWRQLPGAVSAPPAELTGEDAAPSAEEDVEPEETEAERAGGEEEQQA
jgi:hypothetical protein